MMAFSPAPPQHSPAQSAILCETPIEASRPFSMSRTESSGHLHSQHLPACVTALTSSHVHHKVHRSFAWSASPSCSVLQDTGLSLMRQPDNSDQCCYPTCWQAQVVGSNGTTFQCSIATGSLEQGCVTLLHAYLLTTKLLLSD